MGERHRIRLSLKRPSTDDPPDYSAMHRRELEAVRGIELVKARVSREGELEVDFYVLDADVPAEHRAELFLNYLIPEGEKPESVTFTELTGEIQSIPESKVVQLRDLEDR
jgi:hypothetical protein